MTFKGIVLIVVLVLAAVLISACEGEDVETVPVDGGSPSLPPPGPVNPNAFPANPDPFEAAGGDNTRATAGTIVVGDPAQARTIFPANDEDWVAVPLAASTTYEFSAYNLSVRGNTILDLYDAGGILITFNDDWVGFDSAVQYTTVAAETVYVRVIPFDPAMVTTYSLTARVFSDGDGDFFSNVSPTFYDCDDTNLAIFPWAAEFQGDLLDYNCDGQLTPADDGTTAGDGFEPDGGLAIDSKTLNLASGEIFELLRRPELYKDFVGGGDLRKLYTSADVDTVVVTVPAFTQYSTGISNHFLAAGVDGFLYDSVLVQIDSDTVTGFADLPITNTTAAAKTYYIEYKASNATQTGAYVPYIEDLGTDVDGDGYYSRGGGLGWDCDDGDGTIFPGAPGEIVDDGIDTNCNGADNG